MQRLVVGRREHVVVEDVRHRRRQPAVVRRVRVGVRLLEEEELELGAELGLQPVRLEPLELAAEHLPRRGRDRRAVLPADVAEHERVPLDPRDPPQRREVGPQHEVAVAPLPARDLVAGHGIHLHLEREEVVAPLHVLDPVLEEEVLVQALAEQAPLHVGERDDDRVEAVVGSQLVECQHAREFRRLGSSRATGE